MHHSSSGHRGNGPYGAPGQAAATGTDNDRLGNLKRAIDAIEHRLEGSRPPESGLGAGHQQPQHRAPNHNEFGILQDQINRLSSQVASPVMNAREQDLISAQISQRQQLLNSQMAAQNTARTAANPPVANPARAAAPTHQTVSRKSEKTMELINKQLAGLKNELAAIKRQVASPIAIQQRVSQAEIDKIANAIGNLQMAPKFDEASFTRLNQELDSLRKDMRMEVGSTVRREVTDSIAGVTNPNYDAELQNLAAQIDALSQSVEAGNLQTVNSVAPRVDNISLELSDLRTAVEDLPHALAISRLESQLADMASKVDAIGQAEPAAAPEPAFPSQAIESIENRLDEVARALVAVSNSNTKPPEPDLSGLDRVEARLVELGREIDAIASRDNSNDLSQVTTRIDGLIERLNTFEQTVETGKLGPATSAMYSPDFNAVEDQLRGLDEHLRVLTTRVEEAAAQSQTQQLEQQIQQLAARVEEAAGADSTADHLTGLESQIARVLRQLDTLDQSAAVDFTPVEARLGQIETQLSDHQNFSLEAAQKAAQQAVSMMGAQSEPGHMLEALSQDLRSLQAAAEDGNVQTVQTVANVENTLQQIVERLSSIETVISEAPPSHHGAADYETEAPVRLARFADETDEAASHVANQFDTAESASQSQGSYAPAETGHYTAEPFSPDQEEAAFTADGMAEAASQEPELAPIQRSAVESGYPQPDQSDQQDAYTDAPSLDPSEHIEKGYDSSLENHDLLEPGSAPNFGGVPQQPNSPDLNGGIGSDAPVSPSHPDGPSFDESADLNAEINSDVQAPDGTRPDAVAAARRALQATSAEMSAVRDDVVKAPASTGLAAKLESLKPKGGSLRKPLMMGAAALLLAIVAFKGWSMFSGSEMSVANVETPAIESTVSEMGDAAKSTLSDAGNAVENTVSKAGETLGDTVSNAGDAVKSTVSNAGDAVKSTVSDAGDAVKSTVSDAGTAVAGKVEDATSLAKKIGDQPAEAIPVEPRLIGENLGADAATSEPKETAALQETPNSVKTEDAIKDAASAVTASELEVPASAGSAALVAAANAGDKKALFQVGMRYSEGSDVTRNMTESAKWFEKSANQGFAPAQYSVGSLYEKGIGVERNAAKAVEWYEKAAAQGNARAMHNLAVLFANDNVEGVETSLDKAVGWFERAAELGIKDSQFNLGVLYGQGMGVPQNLGDSYKWFALAAKTGDTDAASKRDEVANAMDPDDLEAARKVVNAWAPKELNEAANRVAVPKAWQGKGAPTKNASKGSATVKSAQAALNQRGFSVGTPDGLIGPKTKRAIMEFQRSAGLKITGKVDKNLLKALNLKS